MDLPNITDVFGETSFKALELDGFVIALFNEKGAVRIDVVRKDLTDGITWDELMHIKQHVGFETQDAIELYPSKSDVINTGNIRHLYVLPEKHYLVKR